MNKRYIIWLDDIRDPKYFISVKEEDIVVWVKTYEEFVEEIVKYLGTNKYFIVDLDHDLGEDLSGYDCLKFVVSWCLSNNSDLPEIRIHSQNPVGVENMKYLISNYKRFKSL